RDALAAALADLRASTARILDAWHNDRPLALASAFDYMMQAGYVMGGWHLLRSALVAHAKLDAGNDNPFYTCKLATARFYCESVLPKAAGHAGAVGTVGGLLEFAEAWL
ncbi:MAG: acyl-CoA dehydrogenase C-terminal domain-containing protein, partial [Halieaceae bacterium]|nr:acyl-CoA dehydrogenase C-terminal domain-containing protein [Halieaceae bacterium]